MILGPNGKPLAMDTAHRGASLSARELSSWSPLPGSPDSDLVDELTTLYNDPHISDQQRLNFWEIIASS